VTATELLVELFPAGHAVREEEGVLRGSGRTGSGEVAVLGTTGGLEVGIEAALALAGEVLRIVREHPRRAIVVLVDTRGQRMSLRDEVLGLNGYLAHLAACVELARQGGHRTLAVVHGDAVSGGFLPLGLMADEVYAVAGAHPWVMSLAAMARVTKIPLERLTELSRSSAVLAPGLDGFVRTGAIAPPWAPPLAPLLEAALAQPAARDRRMEEGLARGGRLLAAQVAARVAGGADDP
jgi:malonate decarboxylase gamma subunit